MVDNFTHFSCRLEVGAANIAQALAFYAQMARDLETDDGLSMGFAAETTLDAPDCLWLHGEGRGEPQHVIAFVLRCAEAFNLKGRWGFCWALTCSGTRLDGFGGGAQILDLGARKSLAWTDCSQWLARQLAAGRTL